MALVDTEITALATKAIDEKLILDIFNKTPALKRLRSKQKKIDGGITITAPLAIDSSGEGGFYESRDALSLSAYDAISNSVHQWRWFNETMVLYKPDLAKASGKNAKQNLLSAKLKVMEANAIKKMELAFFSDGTASTGTLSTSQWDGVRAFLQSSGTYGGIASTDLAHWVIGALDDNGGTLRSLTQAILDANFDAAVDGNEGPSVAYCQKGVFTKIKGLLTGIQRIGADSSLSGAGHKGTELMYNGIPYIVSNNMFANSIVHLSEEHVKLYVHNQHDMRRQSIKDLETADAMVERIFMYGNVVADSLKYNSRINDLTV